MQRDPSIHIKESDLVLILEEVFIEYGPRLSKGIKLKDLARNIVVSAKTKAVSSRLIITTNDKLHKRTEKLKLTGRSEAGKFAQILLISRRKLKHRGIELIQPGHKNWPDIKEICSFATDFCNEFSVKLEEGYKQYCTIGLSMMKNYSLFKFKTLHAAICKKYESQLEIESDPTPHETMKFFREYMKHVNEKIGWVSEDLKNNPEKVVCFKRAKDEAKKIGIGVSTYIKAQFYGMEWRNGIPDPFQLYGDKAVERVMKYCYENNISTKQTRTIDVSKIKANGKNHSK